MPSKVDHGRFSRGRTIGRIGKFSDFPASAGREHRTELEGKDRRGSYCTARAHPLAKKAALLMLDAGMGQTCCSSTGGILKYFEETRRQKHFV